MRVEDKLINLRTVLIPKIKKKKEQTGLRTDRAENEQFSSHEIFLLGVVGQETAWEKR